MKYLIALAVACVFYACAHPADRGPRYYSADSGSGYPLTKTAP
jgi:hypothetical protein